MVRAEGSSSGGSTTTASSTEAGTTGDADTVTAGSGASTGVADPLCGNGDIDDGEDCDDAGPSEDCDDDCTVAVCGDGHVNVAAGESCDDGVESESCNANCTPASCGDGVINAAAGETCEKRGESETCDADCTAVECGDGVLNAAAGEACDDGGDSEACNADCTIAICGDGVVNRAAGEECEDENTVDDDACSNACITREPATCDALLTNAMVWGLPAMGVDLRGWTDGTLDWIGCPSQGCEPNEFYCTFDERTETLEFGSVGESVMRAVYDRNDEYGDALPTAADLGNCGNEIFPHAMYNAPDGNNNEVALDGGGEMVTALCAALGYSSGTIVREVDFNHCPEVHALGVDGQAWSSDVVSSSGFGAEYRCVGFAGT